MAIFLLLFACSSSPYSPGTEKSNGEHETLVGYNVPDTGTEEAEPLENDSGFEEEPEDAEEEHEDSGEEAESETPGGWVCHKNFRNGCEICDDAAFDVPADGTPTALVCVTDRGGLGYVSTNTGPVAEGTTIPRCQGWEAQGQSAWDHLDYVTSVVCDDEGLVVPVDLSAWAGQRMWAGVHNLPQGGGHFTEVCIAFWEGE